MAGAQHRATLGVVSVGLAIGVTSAVAVFFLGLMAAFFGWGVPVAVALSSLYIGYGPSFVGAIAGAVWAFVDGLIAGVLIAWFYNRFLLRRRKVSLRRVVILVCGTAPAARSARLRRPVPVQSTRAPRALTQSTMTARAQREIGRASWRGREAHSVGAGACKIRNS